MQDLQKILQDVDPQLLKQAIAQVVTAQEGQGAGDIVDSRPAPYQYSNYVDEETNEIVHYIGRTDGGVQRGDPGTEVGRTKITHPDYDLKALDPEKYRAQVLQAKKDTAEAAAIAKYWIDKGEAIGKASTSPTELRDAVLGISDDANDATMLEAMAAQLVCSDCDKVFPNKKGLRMHCMGAAHMEYAEGMPMWESSNVFRQQQDKLAKEQKEANETE